MENNRFLLALKIRSKVGGVLDHFLYTLEQKQEAGGETNLARMVDGKAAEIEDGLLNLLELHAWSDVLELARDRLPPDMLGKFEANLHKYVQGVVADFRFRIMRRVDSWNCQLLQFGAGEPHQQSSARAKVSSIVDT
jgi:hypothetical protein